MVSVFCSLVVIITSPFEGLNVRTKVVAEGQVIKSNDVNLLVDFSPMAKRQNWQGDYSKVFVKKTDCL